MPNRLSPSSMAASRSCATGFSTIENKPEAPVKSRFQIVCPESEGRPGWIMRATSGRAASQRAISNADR